jgi:hypothetical protein
VTITLAIGDRVMVDDAAPDSFPGVWVVVAHHGILTMITPAVEDPDGSLRLVPVFTERLSLEPPF